ncbi:MAG TPA: hypothetical protein VJ824_13040 [Bacillota bacterium]|nr:hypothetical protein [Bacillota bacterium]
MSRYQFINDHVAVDTETGEKVYRKDAWVKQGQIVTIQDVKNNKNVKHAKFRTAREQKRFYKGLSVNEAGFVLKLIPYMSWETNLVVGDGETGEMNKPLTWSQVDELVGCSKPFRIKVVRSLEEKKVIGYLQVAGRRVGIVINPKYVINGYKPDDSLLETFESNKTVFDEEEDGETDI